VSIASAPTEDIAASIKALLTKGVEQKVFQVKAVESNEAMVNSARTNYFPNISATGLYNRTNRNIQLLENNMLIPVVPFSNINPETGEFYPKRDSTSTSVFNPISGGGKFTIRTATPFSPTTAGCLRISCNLVIRKGQRGAAKSA